MKTLSHREIEIADLIHQGLIEKEIANELHISFSTVHTHSKNIKSKLGARNIADITRIFLTEIKSNAVTFLLALIAAYLILSDTSLFDMLKTALIYFK